MKQLSQIAPLGMFRILDSKNRDVFAQALLLISDKIYTLPVVKMDDVINTLESTFEAVELDTDEDLDRTGEALFDGRSKARAILNTLINRGWLTKEVTTSDFTANLYIPNYAFPMIHAIKEMLEGKEHEYGSLIYRSYTSLHHAIKNKDERGNLLDAIVSAYDASNNLKGNLTQFFNSLHSYRLNIDTTTGSQKILSDLLDKFRIQAEKEYAPIKTVDSYSRYKNPIIEAASTIRLNDDLFNEAIAQMIKKGRADDEEKAANQISSMLLFIEETYAGLSSTLAEIETEYRVYVEKAEMKIRATLTMDRSASGILTQLLKAAAPGGEHSEEALQILESSLAPVPVTTASPDMLYKKISEKTKPKPPNKVSVTPKAISEEDRRKAAERLQRTAKQKAAVRRMLEAATRSSGGRVSTSELPVVNEEDYKNTFSMIKQCMDAAEKEFDVVQVKSNKTISKADRYIIPDLVIERKK